MRAIVRDRYGSPDGALELQEVDRPVIKDDEVLVRVRAASAKTWDVELPAGLRYIGRVVVGQRKPRYGVPGLDLAGRVEAVGKNVTRFQPGGEVFGWCKGALAEYASVSEEALAAKPANLTFEESAVVSMAGLTALQALRDTGQIRPGQDVLVIGASGGVGTLAVQIAKAFGTEVTGVCSARNVELVRSIGADHVIDYTQEDFAQSERRYHLIVDMAGNRTLSDLRRALTPAGVLVMVGSSGSTSSHLWITGLYRWLRAAIISLFVSQKLRAFFQARRQEDLATLSELLETGEVTPVISQQFPLSEAPEAIRRLEEGHTRGNVVISMRDAGPR